jgi:hypothetical protein
MSGQLHPPATLYPGKELPVPVPEDGSREISCKAMSNIPHTMDIVQADFSVVNLILLHACRESLSTGTAIHYLFYLKANTRQHFFAVSD